MIAERRYDEALHLYHQARLRDANNIHLKYDTGQLYERFGLYTDALYTYLKIADELRPRRGRWRNARKIRGLGVNHQNAFVIWYRFAVVLGMGAPLVRELLDPDWQELREWLAPSEQGQLGHKGEERPLRAWELQELRRLIADELTKRYPGQTSQESLGAALHLLLRQSAAGMTQQEGFGTLERCLLSCAEKEARKLARALRWSVSPEGSDNWLEHYNAACLYALMIRGDITEDPEHQPFAHAAIAALELALKYGEDIDFVRTKRYWLQAGDPDLAGLRCYSCFRAFEGRRHRHSQVRALPLSQIHP